MLFTLMLLSVNYCNRGFQHVMLSGTKCSRNSPGNGHIVNIGSMLQQAIYFPQCTFPGDPSTNAQDDRQAGFTSSYAMFVNG